MLASTLQTGRPLLSCPQQQHAHNITEKSWVYYGIFLGFSRASFWLLFAPLSIWRLITILELAQTAAATSLHSCSLPTYDFQSLPPAGRQLETAFAITLTFFFDLVFHQFQFHLCPVNVQ